MKPIRLMFALALLGAAACSSPTEPRLPQPDPDEKEEPPQPGVTVATEESLDGLSFG